VSRYSWPVKRRSPDAAFERRSWSAKTDGLLLPDAIVAARALRRAAQPYARSVRASGPGVFRDAPHEGQPLWVPIGPSTVLRGQAGSRPRISGRVRDLAVSPDGERVYAATANSGVWYSSDGGTTWNPLGGWEATPDAPVMPRAAHALSCGCLLVKFGLLADGSADDVYVGTGELQPVRQGIPGAQLGGVGVLHLAVPLPTALANPFGNHWQREAKNLAGRGIYRMARDPGNPNTLVAATSIGLFTRSGPFVENADWNRVTADPFDFKADDNERTTDVLWTESPSQLWVALVDETLFSDTGVWVSNGGPQGPFENIPLPDVIKEGRLGLAAAPKQQPTDGTLVYVLGKGPRLWQIVGPVARLIGGVPQRLFGESEEKDQSSYDLALAVHPDNSNIVAIAGSGVHAENNVWSASLFKCTVKLQPDGKLAIDFNTANQASPAKDATYVGGNVHADVHLLRFLSVGADVHLWVGCDGGVFRSRLGGEANTFLPCNTGLATTECGYVANHPTNPSIVIAGTQDNGMLERIGDSVWRLSKDAQGDSGGVMFNVRDPRYFLSQYTNSSWRSNGQLLPPVRRPGARDSDTKNEDGASSFYSGGDVRRVAHPDRVRVAIGTNRVWMMEDWLPTRPPNANILQNTWVTLPSFKDPRQDDPGNSGTDVLDSDNGAVVACRFVSDGQLLVLYERTVVLYSENTGSVKWNQRSLTKTPSHCGSWENDDLPSGPTSSFLPPLGAWSDLAVHDPPRGSFYVATTGYAKTKGNTVSEADRMDTLWWYDGTGTWRRTGLRNDDTPASRGSKAPAYAVVCDPDNRDVVFVGTALGVWRGELSSAGGAPSWTWRMFSNGLPEAPVQDLAFHANGGLKLLRAAIQARGVWEVDLSTSPVPTTQTYLRVHATDSRRQVPTDLTYPFADTTMPFNWHQSADIRVRPAPLDPSAVLPPPPPDLPWSKANFRGKASFTPYLLWVFQTALHRLDPLCVPDGEWTGQFDARLKAFNPSQPVEIDLARWTSVVNNFTVYSPPWDGSEPTEADLAERVVERVFFWVQGATSEEFTTIGLEPCSVDVLVHHRDLRSVPGSDVRVALLRCPLPVPGGPEDFSLFAIDAAWKAAVASFVRGEATAGPIPAPWVVADATRSVRQPTRPVDARMPRAVTFDVDFSGLPAANAPAQLLLAIVHAASDELTEASLVGGTLRDLVLNCHHVAAKIVTF
jgi:hypothetical protein